MHSRDGEDDGERVGGFDGGGSAGGGGVGGDGGERTLQQSSQPVYVISQFEDQCMTPS